MRPRLDPAVALVRQAVRRCLVNVDPGELVLAACSGGADSLALSAALAFEAPRAGLHAGAVVVDHGLQSGSADVAARVADGLRGRALSPVEVVRAAVRNSGQGVEAAARAARYAALDDAAVRLGAAAVLLGHTLDDQAETVLLGLARGSGARSLAGMRPASGRWLRPMLSVPRDATVAACAAEGLPVWHDPHNSDPRFTRARVRAHVLPMLERELGPGVSAALARTAEQLAGDADALDAWAFAASARCQGDHGLLTGEMERLPRAVRSRVLRQAALDAGCPPTDLAAVHVDALDALVTQWHGQRAVDLPGRVRAVRRNAEVLFERAAVAG